MTGQATRRPGPLRSAASKDRFKRVGRCVLPLFCRIRGAVGKEKGRLKTYSAKNRRSTATREVIHSDATIPATLRSCFACIFAMSNSARRRAMSSGVRRATLQ